MRAHVIGILLLLVMFTLPEQAFAQTAFRFGTWGDAQDLGRNLPRTSNQIKTLNPAFIIFNGDFSADGVTLDSTSAYSMQTMTNAMKGNPVGYTGTNDNGIFAKTFLVRGNHDDHLTNNESLWQSFFNSNPLAQGNMAARVTRVGARNYMYLSGEDNLTYSFDYGNARFISIDVPGSVYELNDACPTSNPNCQTNFIESRLADAETRPELQHAFINFHGPLYCISSHCTCTAAKDPACIPSDALKVIESINRHPIVSATFHGHEHNMAWTHLDSTRITGLTRPYEQFVTSPSGTSTYNDRLKTGRVTEWDPTNTQGFGIVDVSGASFTVTFYRVNLSGTTPINVWSRTFTKTGMPTPPPTIRPTASPSPLPGTTPTPSPRPTASPNPQPTTSPSPRPTPLPTALPPGSSVLIPKGASWKYLDNGTNQGTSWRSTTFSDATWKTGLAELGYGDGDEQTVVSYGPTSSSKYITTYFRKSFSISNPSAVTSLIVRLLRDDGAVVYLNGTEIYRNNMPSGTISYTTVSATSDQDNDTFFQSSVSPSLLMSGTNIVAVEVHQAYASSSDLSFDFELVASINGATASPRPTITPTPAPTPIPTIGLTSGLDYVRWQKNYNSMVTPGTGGDYNRDGIVNLSDLIIWLSHYTP